MYNEEEIHMAVSYNGLWKLLIDKKMKKVDMMNQVGISSSTRSGRPNVPPPGSGSVIRSPHRKVYTVSINVIISVNMQVPSECRLYLFAL